MKFLGSICILIFIHSLDQDVYLISTYGIREIVYKYKFVKFLLSLTNNKFSTVQ